MSFKLPEVNKAESKWQRLLVPEGFHDEVLDLVWRQPCLLCDGLEGQCSVVRASLEHRLHQRHQTDLLAEE